MRRSVLLAFLLLAACASPRTAVTTQTQAPTVAAPTEAPRTVVNSDGETLRVSSTGSCGTERWNVKTGSDADARRVPLSSYVQTTIAALRSKPHPSSLPPNNRIAPVETTDWWLQMKLVKFKTEDDQDIHLVIADSSGHTMIAELPNPSCVSSASVMRPAIAHSRTKFAQYYTATSTWHTVNRTMRIRGAGFFDFLHGQTGVAPNGIEIHPIFDLSFP